MTHIHDIVPGRKPEHLKCKTCSWRFPCPEATCGHFDCIETKGKLPACYYCSKQVEGPAWGSWCPWNVHNHARAVHFSCRSEHATQEEKTLWGEI